MEEKHEGTPNPLNPNLEADTPDLEDRADTEMSSVKKRVTVDIKDAEEETFDKVEQTEITTSEIKEDESFVSPVEPKEQEQKKEPAKDTATKIKITEAKSEEVESTDKNSPKPESETKDKQIPDPTSEESAYQPPQEVKVSKAKPNDEERSFDIPKGPVVPESAQEPDSFETLRDTAKSTPVIDMVKPTQQPTELVEEDLVMEEDYTPGTAANTAAMMAGMGGLVSSQANLDPTNRPMEHMQPISQPPKRKNKRTGLIIGMIVSLFIAVFCGVAAALIFMNGNKEDRVAIAMSRVMNNESPKNITIGGTINMKMEDQASPVSNIDVNIKSDITTSSLINSSSATLDVNFRDNDKNMSLNLNEVYASGNDLYFMVDGINDLMADGTISLNKGSTSVSETETVANGESVVTERTQTDCVDGPEGTDCIEASESTVCEEDDANCSVTTMETGGIVSLLPMLKMLEPIDGEWIRVPIDELNTSSSADTTGGGMSCLASLATGIRNNSNTIAGIYNKYPFVADANQKTTIASAGNPVYRVLINEDNFANFINEVQNSSAMSEWTSCVGRVNAKAAIESLIESASNLPELYVEINDDNDFTRVYFTTELRDNCCPEGEQCVQGCDESATKTLTVDFNFAYPASVNVSEPSEYTNLSDVLQNLSSSMFVVGGAEVDSAENTSGEAPQS